MNRKQKKTKDVVSDKVTTILSRSSLDALKAAFDVNKIDDLFRDVMRDRYERTEPYVEMLQTRFHERQPKDVPGERGKVRVRLSAEDRERCIIAILASRGAVRNLGVHIYVALMLGVSPQEIADAIFLAGVYSGVPAVADGLDTQIQVLTWLQKLVTEKEVFDSVAGPLKATKPDGRVVLALLSLKLQL
jgi:alkylhydroperoxidase/carboxymuconolactone decarboxylase family protein YurZ